MNSSWACLSRLVTYKSSQFAGKRMINHNKSNGVTNNRQERLTNRSECDLRSIAPEKGSVSYIWSCQEIHKCESANDIGGGGAQCWPETTGTRAGSPTPRSGGFRATETYPTQGPARKRRELYFLSTNLKKNISRGFIRHSKNVELTCSNGCPATILKNLSSPSRLPSMTSSENLFVNTFPGSGGILTRVDSRSRMSRKASKSE